MNDYQMPLFDRYDMSVAFDQRLAGIERPMEINWSAYAALTDDELISCFCFEICPIQLFTEKASLDQEWEPPFSRFSLAVPYFGDDELWHLYPARGLGVIDGEVFRGELILTSLAKKETDARAEFDRRLSQILMVIGQQQERIRLFEEAAALFIKTEALKARARSLALFTGLQH